MTLPESPSHRKPARLGLYAPFAVLGAVATLWSVGWVWARDTVFRGMDAAADALDQAGYRVDWSGRAVSGYPFRLDLDISGARIREASGWGVEAPQLKAESYFLFGQDHWVIVAPDGGTLFRPAGGPVFLRAKVLRASLSDPAAHPPRLSMEGLGLTFTPAPGSTPFGLASADEFHLHTRSGPQDRGAVYLEIDKATPVSGLLADIGSGGPVTLIADTLFSHAGALTDPAGVDAGVAGAVQAWSAAGGSLGLRRLSLHAGAAGVEANTGILAIGPDGRLQGALPVTLRSASRLMEAVSARAALAPETLRAAQAVLAAHAKGNFAAVTLDFQAGQTTLGPVAIGPAPRLIPDPRLDRPTDKAHRCGLPAPEPSSRLLRHDPLSPRSGIEGRGRRGSPSA